MRLQSHCLTVVSLSPNIQPALTELVSGSMRTEQFEAGSPSGHVSLYTLSFELFCTKSALSIPTQTLIIPHNCSPISPAVQRSPGVVSPRDWRMSSLNAAARSPRWAARCEDFISRPGVTIYCGEKWQEGQIRIPARWTEFVLPAGFIGP